MQITAMILGIIGALLGLAVGWFTYGAMSVASHAGYPGGGVPIFYLIVPLCGLLGSALTLVNPVLAGSLLLTSAVLTITAFGFGVLTAVSIILMGISGSLLFVATPEGIKSVMRMSARANAVKESMTEPAGLVATASQLGHFIRTAGMEPFDKLKGQDRRGKPNQRLSLVADNGSIDYALPHRKLTSGGVLLGRADGCDVVIDDKSVSRSHARIWIDNAGKVMVEDLNSANGTWCDERRVRKAGVAIGTTLRLGKISLFLQEETS